MIISLNYVSILYLHDVCYDENKNMNYNDHDGDNDDDDYFNADDEGRALHMFDNFFNH